MAITPQNVFDETQKEINKRIPLIEKIIDNIIMENSDEIITNNYIKIFENNIDFNKDDCEYDEDMVIFPKHLRRYIYQTLVEIYKGWDLSSNMLQKNPSVSYHIVFRLKEGITFVPKFNKLDKKITKKKNNRFEIMDI